MHTYGFHAVPQNGVRRFGAFAADAHHCIMVRVLTPPNRRMWHECSCTHTRAPPRPLGHPDTTQLCRRARSRKGQALRVALRAILDRFCARRLLLDRGSGRRNVFQVEQRNRGKRKWIGPLGPPLDKKRPIEGVEHG